MNTIQILSGIALILAVCGIVRPSWPLVPVAIILIAVAIFIRA